MSYKEQGLRPEDQESNSLSIPNPQSSNLLSPIKVKQLLARYGLHPKKRFGQNFLIDRNILVKILDASGLNADSCILEIGAGLGTVTSEAAHKAKQVVAVEKDKDLIPVLQETAGGLGNVEILQADFLELDMEEFLTSRFGKNRCTVIANLPYYITTPIIVKLLNVKSRIDRMVLMVQKEVADRIKASPDTPNYGSLSVLIQYHCAIDIIAQAKRTIFYPAPEVDSSVVRLDVRQTPAVVVPDEALFFKIVRASFGQRRKTLLRSLSGSPDLGWSKEKARTALDRAGIDPSRRGETLSLDEFASLTLNAE